MSTRTGLTLTLLALAAFVACNGGVTTTNDHPTGAGGASSSSSASGVSTTCTTLCSLAAQCAGSDAASCGKECATEATGACSLALTALEHCLSVNEADFQCGVSAKCDAQIASYRKCTQDNFKGGDAASTSVGSGGFGPGGCNVPSCHASIVGTCDCSVNCTGEANTASCIAIPGGGQLCACASAAGDLGACVSGPQCDLDASCCSKHF